jgi:hypothetical protein
VCRFGDRSFRFATARSLVGFTPCALREPSFPRHLARSFAKIVVGHPVLSFCPSSSTKASASFSGFIGDYYGVG